VSQLAELERRIRALEALGAESLTPNKAFLGAGGVEEPPTGLTKAEVEAIVKALAVLLAEKGAAGGVPSSVGALAIAGTAALGDALIGTGAGAAAWSHEPPIWNVTEFLTALGMFRTKTTIVELPLAESKVVNIEKTSLGLNATAAGGTTITGFNVMGFKPGGGEWLSFVNIGVEPITLVNAVGAGAQKLSFSTGANIVVPSFHSALLNNISAAWRDISVR
jgi:hypothetical protein